MKQMFSKSKWIIIAVVVFPFLFGFLVAQPKWPYWAFAGDADTWLTFWGTYIGALGTVLMAVVAVESLKLSKKQNRPIVYPSIEVVVQKQYDPLAEEEVYKWFNEVCYCLRVKNFGIEAATKIQINVSCSNPDLFKNEFVSGRVNWLNNLEFALGSKEEKLLYLCPAEITPDIRRGEKKENVFLFDSFIEEFKKSMVSVELSYDEDESRTPKVFTFPINEALTAQTTMIQVLDSINRSLQNLEIKK